MREVGDKLRVGLPGGDVLFLPVLPGILQRTPGLWTLVLYYYQECVVMDNYGARQWLGNGMTVIDAGANIGAFALLSSRMVGVEGRVVAVEPVPANVEALFSALAENNLNNVSVVPLALGSKRCTSRMWLHRSDPGQHSLVRHVGDESMEVPTTTIDDLVTETGLERVDMIKADVEGAELDLLQGARATIEQFRPVIVAAAYHDPAHAAQLPILIADIAPDYEVTVRSRLPGLEVECFAVPAEKAAVRNTGSARLRGTYEHA